MKELAQFRTLCCSNSSITIGILSFWLVTTSCSQNPENRPSPLRVDSVQIGSTTLRVEYSSPSVRGRKIFGIGDTYLEQYGKIWRTGANEATTFSTDRDLKIDTFDLPKGKYAIFTIPDSNSWEVIFNKEWNQWGTYYHKDSLDVVRLRVTPTKLDSLQEQMKLSVSPSALNFRWDNITWSIPISLSE